MNRRNRIAIVAAAAFCLSLAGPSAVLAQGAGAQGAFTPEQYKKALWMVTRFYGGQRSGIGPNWLIMEHENPAYRTSFTQDAKDGRNLEGGWFDCGDHVTFGHTFFFAAYMLAKAYEEFPAGFHDLYHGKDYSDYAASQNWSISGGSPNGVPDLLEELKYATDWIIKAAPNDATFYYEKGHGGKDHTNWVTAGKMSTLSVDGGGEPRDIFSNPNDGRMPSFAAATLAVMSKIYGKYDEPYAELCLTHAKHAYAYAKSKKNNSAGAASGSYYGAGKDPETTFIIAAAEMFLATNDNAYKNDIVKGDLKDHYWAFDYSNTHDLSYYTAGMALPEDKSSILGDLKSTFITRFAGQVNGEKLSTRGNGDWGALRYPANHAFIAALYSKAMGTTEYDQFIFNQVDFILGENTAKQSFVVGFCEGCAKQATKPHHRNVYLNDNNPTDAEKQQMPIPERNKYFGYMVGGSFASGDYKDDINNYQYTEGGIDYNAGLLGSLAYIVSKLAPADTSKLVPPIGRPIRIELSTSPDPSAAASFLVDTLAVNAGDNSTVTVYIHSFLENGAPFDMAATCNQVAWSINETEFASGCSLVIPADTPVPATLTAEYFAPSPDRLPLKKSVTIARKTSVTHRAAPLAKAGYAVSVRPGAVTFTAAAGRTITNLGVYNMQGKKIFGRSGAYTEIKWDSANRPRGMYVMKMSMGSGAVVQRRLMLK
ncbi:MAG: glycoside hydrolase family 9 protein [Chitinispirillales bacterium]|jgi:hypothetical protein|nr:glycoside hydrolase family 9 protein [Chitinispirillales bacterium]